MEQFMDFLRSFNIWTVLIRLVLCLIFGGIIGMERGRQGRAAGMRTHILVSMGAALASMMGFYITEVLEMSGDPMRISAQVISGIGFLGYLTRTRAAASSHLGINTGTFLADIPREAAVTGGETQGSIQGINDAVYRFGSRIGAEIFALIRISLSRHYQTGIGIIGDFDIGARFCILQANVILGMVLFDEGIFQGQRLDLGVAQKIFKILNGGHHSGCFDMLLTILKILGHPILQLTGLSHIDHLTCAILHDIYTRRQG